MSAEASTDKPEGLQYIYCTRLVGKCKMLLALTSMNINNNLYYNTFKLIFTAYE